MATRIVALLILFSVLSANTYGQNDSSAYRRLFYMCVGPSMPMAEFAAAQSGKGFAKTGITLHAGFQQTFFKFIDLQLSYQFMQHGVDVNAIKNTMNQAIADQLGTNAQTVQINTADWQLQTLGIMVGIKKIFEKKSSLFMHVGGGYLFGKTPSSETLVQVNQLFFTTKTDAAKNFVPMINADAGFVYQLGPKTGLVIQVAYTQAMLSGNNLNITEIGNNSFQNAKYSFEQKITTLQPTIGLSTHF